jgi:hypothetical protein
MTYRACALAVTVCLVGAGAEAAEREGVVMPDTASVAGRGLVSNGPGAREVALLKVPVHGAAFYPQQKTGGPGTAVPWRLVPCLVRDVGAGDIRKALEEGLAKQPGSAGLAKKIEAANVATGDLSGGDTLVLDHDPAARMRGDAKRRGGPTIEGGDFAKALHGFWTGAEPPDPEPKSGLLGGGCA